MLKLTDCGCAQHPPQHATLTGPAAALVGHMIANLPQTNAGHTYICEQGHTHCLRLQTLEGNVAEGLPMFGLTGNTAINH